MSTRLPKNVQDAPTRHEIVCFVALSAESIVDFDFNEAGVLAPYLVRNTAEDGTPLDDIELQWSDGPELVGLYNDGNRGALTQWAVKKSGPKTTRSGWQPHPAGIAPIVKEPKRADRAEQPSRHDILCGVVLFALGQVFFYYNSAGVIKPYLLCSAPSVTPSESIELDWDECPRILDIFKAKQYVGLLSWAKNKKRRHPELREKTPGYASSVFTDDEAPLAGVAS